MMNTNIKIPCTFEHSFCTKRYIFVDEDKSYYLWQLAFSEYGLTVEITSFKQNNDDFIVFDNPKIEMITSYIQEILTDQNSSFIAKFFESIGDFEFEIEKKYRDALGNKFCNIFLSEQDREFILQDKYAKHLIIDFEKIQARELVFFNQPELFPLYIPEIGVNVTKEAKLCKDLKEINLETFWLLYEQYKTTLIKQIKQKNKMLINIEQDLIYRYKKASKQIKKENIDDYELEAYISVFDVFSNEYEITKVIFSKHSLSEAKTYSLAVFSLDIEVNRIMYHLIDTFGIKIVTTKLHYWSELIIRNQKFFNV